MSWQEDLAELDRTLAEGRISADDYRRRRDELLAAASGGGPAAPTPPNSGPFAPPVRWDAVPPSQANPNPDATQIVTPGAPQQHQQHNPDKTQVVSPNQRPADADRTQFVSPVAPQQMPPQQQGGWQSGPPTSTPPWGSDSYSPIGDANPSWIAQGPEVFDESGGGKGKVIGIVLAVVLLAGIAFGAYWIWGRGGSTPSADGTGAQTPTTTTSTTPSAPPDPLPLGKIPGKVSTNKAVTDFTAVPALKYLLDSESALYTSSGATKTKLAQFTLDDGSKGIILIVQGADATAAAAGALGLHNIQINNGMEQVTDGPAGVMAGSIDAKEGQNARVRGHYSSKDLIVRVDVAAPSLAAARQGFDDALDAQIEALSADG